LRCLIAKVVLDRQAPDTIGTRIVWRGGAVTELVLPCTVGRLADWSDFRQLEAQILRLEARGKSAEEIAQVLTAQGVRSSQPPELLASTVKLLRLRHGHLHRYKGPRPRRSAGCLTIPQIAAAGGVKPHWLYPLLSRGRIVGQRDDETGLSRFPDSPQTLEAFRQLRDGQLTEFTY
jgi:hypothetical protein